MGRRGVERHCDGHTEQAGGEKFGKVVVLKSPHALEHELWWSSQVGVANFQCRSSALVNCGGLLGIFGIEFTLTVLLGEEKERDDHANEHDNNARGISPVSAI